MHIKGIMERVSQMSPEHEAHCERIVNQFSDDFRKKYQKGQAEHGGRIWTKPGMLDHAIEEAIDLVCYLYTLRDQLNERQQP